MVRWFEWAKLNQPWQSDLFTFILKRQNRRVYLIAFWGALWRECLETSVLLAWRDAQKRIGLFIDYYNSRRPHQGLGGIVPANRFFGAEPDVP